MMGDLEQRPHPRLFFMLPTTLTTGDTPIELPPDETCEAVHDCHPVIAISRTVPRYTSPADATGYILGIGVGISVHEQRWHDEADPLLYPSRLLSRSLRGWGIINTQFEPGAGSADLTFETLLNGDVISSAALGELPFSPSWLVSYLSRYITLGAGDLIFVGSPQIGHDRPLVPGDLAGASLAGVATLSVPVTEIAVPLPVLEPRARTEAAHAASST
jgi:fumarylpyruvate hydrolase